MSALLQDEDLAFDLLPEDERARRPLATLLRTQARGRLSHALLLAGPPGSGKRHAAVRLAQLLACENPGAAGPCLHCEACRKTEEGLDPEVHELVPPIDPKTGRPKGEIPVERVRALQERLSFRSSGARRVAIVEPADRLSLVAQEAVLKTLEEPPEGVTLLLLTTRPASLKPTVRSRCQLVRFASPPPEAVAAILEAKGRPAEQARLAAALTGGDLRRALALDAEGAAEEWIELGRRLYELLGAQGEARARDLALEMAPQGGGGGAHADIAERLDLLERVLRDVMLAGERGDEPDEELAARLTHPGGVGAVRALSKRLTPVAAARSLDEIATARGDLQLRMNAKVVLTGLLLELHRLARTGA